MKIRHQILTAHIALLLGSALVGPGRVSAADESEGLTPNAHFMSGKLYMQQKVFEKAEHEFSMAVVGDSTNAGYRNLWGAAICEVAMGELAGKAGIADQAERRKSVSELNPMFAKASTEFDKAGMLDPKVADDAETNRQHYWVILYKQGTNLADNKRYEDALEIFKLNTALDPKEPQGFFQVAYMTEKLGDTREAVRLAKESKTMAETRIAELGDCSQFKSSARKTDCKKTINTMNVIMRNVDSFTRARFAALGADSFDRAEKATDAAEKQKLYNEAIGFYDAALQQDPSLSGVKFDLANSRFQLAKSLEDAGDKSASKEAYDSAAADFVKLADAAGDSSIDAETHSLSLYNAASAYYSAGEFDKAAPLFKRYIDGSPKESAPWKLTGTCLIEMGQRLDGLSYLAMGNAVSDKASTVLVTESVGTVKNMYSASSAAKALDELGQPDEVKSVPDKANNRDVVTWIWWKKGEARHFVNGEELGRVKFQGVSM